MTKRKKTAEPEEKRSAADYYKLNVRAVEDLVNADVSNSPKVSEEELRKYRSGPKLRLSDITKVILIKAWFGGMVCFFFFWGLGIYVSDQLDQLLILGLALGFVTDLITNNVFRFYARTPGANDRWMMFPKRKFITLPLNVLYAFLILFCVVSTYNVINIVLAAVTGAQDTVPLGVGPILFGIFSMAWDMLFLGMKRMAKRMLTDAKQNQR
ncbi:MAG: hypothetical protein IJ214_05880 [Clostridia bacterium]|nr:hypothetical protein [Clostridia bacterium]